MKKILVSACLYGEGIVRYDGKEKPLSDPLFLKWKSEGRLIPLCPEILAGLPVPRARTEQKGARVITSEGGDLTEAFHKAGELALQTAKDADIAFAIFKENSPSCGVNSVYDGTFSGMKINKSGITTEYLKAAGYKVFSEHELDAAERYLIDQESSII